MKKVITICLLSVALLTGGMSMDAKTTNKKSKSKARTSISTTKTSHSKKKDNTFSVAGHKYEYGLSFNYSKSWTFNKNGTGSMYHYLVLLGKTDSGTEDFKWSQSGKDVFINNSFFGTVSEDGKSITISNDEKVTRVDE